MDITHGVTQLNRRNYPRSLAKVAGTRVFRHSNGSCTSVPMFPEQWGVNPLSQPGMMLLSSFFFVRDGPARGRVLI